MIEKQEIERFANELERCRPLLIAMGDQTRQHIVLQMLRHATGSKGMRVPQIVAYSHLSRPAVSHHLQILKKADLVKVRHEGTKNYYYFSSTHAVDDLIGTLQLAQKLMQKIPEDME